MSKTTFMRNTIPTRDKDCLATVKANEIKHLVVHLFFHQGKYWCYFIGVSVELNKWVTIQQTWLDKCANAAWMSMTPLWLWHCLLLLSVPYSKIYCDKWNNSLFLKICLWIILCTLSHVWQWNCRQWSISMLSCLIWKTIHES